MSRVLHASLHIALALVLALTLGAEASASGDDSAIVVHVDRGGFRWSDAAVGLIAGVGLSVAVAGCLALLPTRGTGKRISTKGDHS